MFEQDSRQVLDSLPQASVFKIEAVAAPASLLPAKRAPAIYNPMLAILINKFDVPYLNMH